MRSCVPMSRSRIPLPIDAVLPEVEAAWRQHANLVLEAPTGAGKTTRLPAWLARSGLVPEGQIILLEPRRVAARAAARRIAKEAGSTLGDFAGYHVRFDRRASERTRIVAMTEGLFLRRLQGDPFLDGVVAVLFDEFHERHLDGDLALALTRRVQEEVRPDLRIAAFSATLEVDPLTRFLGEAPRVISAGRSYPVERRHRDHSHTRPLPEQVAEATRELASAIEGDVLVFLPGVGEIERTQRELERWAAAERLDLVPLYGDLDAKRQDRALESGTRRRIVLATNVAESSVTVAGIRGVVDSGWVRELRFDPGVGLDRLELTRISRASARQRAGRAGREAPGVCWRLWSRREHDALDEKTTPEVARNDLSGAVLQLRVWGETDPRAFPWFEPPPTDAIERADALLRQLGALDPSLAVTRLGRRLADLPVSPRLGRVLLASDSFGHSRRLALVAALASERDAFERGATSDLLARVEAVERYARSKQVRSNVGVLKPGAADHVLRVQRQLVGSLERSEVFGGDEVSDASGVIDGGEVIDGGGAGDSSSVAPVSRDDAVRRAILAGFPDRVARRRPGDPTRAVLVGGRGLEVQTDAAHTPSDLLVAWEIAPPRRGTRAGEGLVRVAIDIDRAWLAPELLATERQLTFSAEREAIDVRIVDRYVDLVLDERIAAPHPNGDEARAATAMLAEVVRAEPGRLIDPSDPDVTQLLARIETLRIHCPERELAALDLSEIAATLVTHELRLSDVRKKSIPAAILGSYSYDDQQFIEREAPERIPVPSGRAVKLEYRPGAAPILAARIQEMFGLRQTPRIARGRVPVLLHLLAPNGRPQQVTDDLESFWSTTYFEIRKELRRRYPKHAWPDEV